MKLRIIATGGTIGCTCSGDCISLKQGMTLKLLKLYEERFELDFDYELTEPYRILSENSSGENIRQLVRSVRAEIDKDCDGIIVLHGTDTLPYSAAALGYCLGVSSKPVCLVSSDRPVEDAAANGLYNLLAAVVLIRDGSFRGVWVPYRNPGEKITALHRATRLLSGGCFSAALYSMYGETAGWLTEDGVLHRRQEYGERKDAIGALDAEALTECSSHMVRISVYPGIRYPEISEDIRYILLESYHSGTVATETAGALRFYGQMKERGISVFLAGAGDGAQYESTKAYAALGIRPVVNIAPIALYMKLWLADACGRAAESVLDYSLGGDLYI